MLEAVVARQLRNVPAVVSETPAETTAHLGSLLEQLPLDPKGRIILFQHKMVNLLLDPAATLIIRFTAEGLSFTSDPPIVVDGPARLDFKFDGVRYSFPDGAFHLDLQGGGGMIADLLKDVAINQAQKRLDAKLKPLLPAAMQVPGYSLASDPLSTEHVQQIVKNFGSLGRKKKP